MLNERAWLPFDPRSADCQIMVQIFDTGRVTLIHTTSTDQSLTQDSGNVFRVRWLAGAFPRVGRKHRDRSTEPSSHFPLDDVSFERD